MIPKSGNRRLIFAHSVWLAREEIVIGGLTTLKEDQIYDEVEKVIPGFRRDFDGISARVKRLQPWLDVAHKRMVTTEMEFDRVYRAF